MRWLLMLVVGLAACSGCEDEVSPVGADMGETVDMPEDAVLKSDLGTVDLGTPDVADQGADSVDLGAADVSTADVPDMPAKPTGPRDDVTFKTHDIIYQPRVTHLNIVPTADAFYLATSSAGDPVTFSLGKPDELVMTAEAHDSFGAIWARYTNALNIEAADQISSFPGGPRLGGTANGDQLVIDGDGSRIMAGSFFGSVDFGGTVWSTNFSNSGALTTSSGGYVVRTTDNTVDAMFRLRTSAASRNVSITGLALHANGDLTISGLSSGEVIFPDDSKLDTGRGFVARTSAAGTPIWSMALPSYSYLTAAGDDVLVRFTYRDAFELGAKSYPAPADGYGVALVAIDPAGDVRWIHRIETAPSRAYIRAPRVAADGRIFVPFRAEGETALDLDTPPDPTGYAHLWVLNPDGTLDWAATAPFAEYKSIALDDSGVIWAAAGICETNGATIQPAWGDPVSAAPCDPIDGVSTWFLLGLDPDDGSIGFAHALFRGAGGIDEIEVLSNGAVLVGAHYRDPSTVLPDTPAAFEVDQLGTGANDMNGLLLMFD